MSSQSAWSLTHTVTYWPITGRGEWDGLPTFGGPVSAPCDYKADTRTTMDALGGEALA
jgi:hypothetical protein